MKIRGPTNSHFNGTQHVAMTIIHQAGGSVTRYN